MRFVLAELTAAQYTQTWHGGQPPCRDLQSAVLYHAGLTDGGQVMGPTALEPSLLEQGLQLLLYGMGTVVLFLVLLVFAMHLMSTLILRFFPEPQTAPPQPREVALDIPDESLDPVLVAAAVAAVHRHREASGAARRK